jgi:diguanylate cyclase (GGDEF)-like protein
MTGGGTEADGKEGGMSVEPRGAAPLSKRLPVAVGAAAFAPAALLAAAAGAAAAPGAAALALAAGVVGAGAAAFAAHRLLRPLGALAERVSPRSGAGPADEVARLSEAVASLTRRLETAVKRGDPARLDDPLTGLPNRLSVMRRGRDEITRSRRNGHGLSLALFAVDADDLAALGAAEGDRALRVCGETLVQTLRAYDVVGRWEGATFVALMPEAEVENAVDAMRRVQAQLAAAAGAASGLVRQPRTHAGVAVLHPEDATLADIAARAAAALDRARGGPGAPVQAAPGPRTRPATLTSV